MKTFKYKLIIISRIRDDERDAPGRMGGKANTPRGNGNISIATGTQWWTAINKIKTQFPSWLKSATLPVDPLQWDQMMNHQHSCF